MTLSSNMNFTPMKNTDGKVSISVAKNCAVEDYFSRDSVTDIAHNAGSVFHHPAFPMLTRNGENHLLFSGSCEVRYTLQDYVNNKSVQVNQDEAINQATQYILSETPDAVVHSEGRDFVVSWTVSYTQTDWAVLKLTHAPACDTAKITITGEGDFACFMRIDGEPDAWTVRYKDIPAGTESVIEKQGDHCYVFFSTDVQKGDTTLTAYKHYKLTSSEITVSAAENTKVVRMSRD